MTDPAPRDPLRADLERQVLVRTRALEASYALGQAVSSELKMEPLCDLIVTHLAGVLRPESIHLLFLDWEADELYVKRSLDSGGRDLSQLRVRPGEGVAGVALLRRAAARDLGEPGTQPVAPGDQEPFPPPVVAQPLLAENRVKGVLVLRWVPGSGRPTLEDLQMLEVLGTQVALNIDNAWLYGEINRLNEGLERQVRRRTEELHHRNEELARALGELKSTQAQLVQSAKMSSLGQLTAGIAHEINNPLAYSVSNITMVGERLDRLRLRVALLEALADPDGGGPEPLLLRLAQDPRYAADLAELRAEQARLDPPEGQALSLEFLRYVRLREEAAAGLSPGMLDSLERLLQRSHQGLHRVKEIVLHLRRFSHLDEAQQQLADLDEGVASTLSLVEHSARERGLRLRHEPGLTAPYSCHPATLNQVVMNLVSNAMQACDEGGEVVVRTEETDGGPRVQVADTGCGIPAEHLDRIFDPFFTTKPVGQGTGLGLSLSYKIVSQHGGQIAVRARAGGGTVFTVELPPRRGDNTR